ncbi:MAG: hypothetical protein AAFY11_03135 [Cyanobacteria bacterium J06641_5]
MKYPSRSEYYSAIRNPRFAFRKKDPVTRIERDLDPELAAGQVIERVRPNGMREAWSASGGFAIAFKYATPSQKLWAVRCFYRSGFEATQHYRKVTTNLEKNPAYRAHFVGCQYIEEGIRVLGSCYPVVKMEWVEGSNLKRFIKQNLDFSDRLQKLASRWQDLAKNLQQGKLAHGDLQHGNILVVERRNDLELKLIDYDSLYFERDGNSIEDRVKGLPDYQHPLRESLKKQCLEIDFFPQLVIYTSILALAAKPQLWDSYNLEATEGLLFSKADFQYPDRAPVFETLLRLPQPLPALSRSIKNICGYKNFAQIPSLEAVLGTSRTTRAGFMRQSFGKHSASAKQQQKSSSFLSRLIGRGNPKPIPSKPNTPSEPAQQQPAAHQGLNARGGDRDVATVPVEVEIVWNKQQSPAPAVSVGQAGDDSPSPAKIKAPEVISQQAQNQQVFNNSSNLPSPKLAWDPRVHKKTTSTPGSQPAPQPVAETPDKPTLPQQSAHLALEKPSQAVQTGDHPFAWITQTEKTVGDAYSTVKQNITQFLTPKTWPTRDVANSIDRPATWCHRQRYKYPDKFRLGKQYLKDSEGIICWTRSGIQQLRSLGKKEHAIPPSLLPTKAVGALLEVPTEHITKLRAKYKLEFIEGTHYFIDSQKRYHWTADGIERLKSRLTLPKATNTTPKTSRKKRKAKRDRTK